MDGALVLRIAAISAAFGLTVFVHEAGHYLAARMWGMAVREFSIGFGRPLLYAFRRGETQYSLRLWPFISFVHIAGMEPGDDHPKGFSKKPRYAQASVLVMGCVMNVALAVAIFIFMGAAIGMPVAVNSVEQVMPDTPAAKVGLMPGDRLLGVSGRADLSVVEIQEAIQAHPGEEMVLEIERDGVRRSIAVTPKVEMATEVDGLSIKEVEIGLIGIVFASRLEPMGIGKSVVLGFSATYDMIRLQTAGMIATVLRRLPMEFVGPVGVMHVLYSEAKANWLRFLYMFATLTVAIGFLNLLPIPPLDGSRLVILGIEAVRGKPFDKRKEVVVHLVGFALVLVLAAVLTYKDIVRIVTGGSW